MNTLLPFFGVIRVTGDDRHEFLHNQFSNDIKNLSDKTACYATYNTPKGRVIANMLAYCADDAVFLILAADLVIFLMEFLVADFRIAAVQKIKKVAMLK